MLGHGIHLGRVFGVRIELDWSLVFIFALVSVSLAVGVFPAWHPQWAAALSWGVGIAAAALLMLSILVHELAHSVVARIFGIPVRSITLFLFGGVSSIERDPASPGQEALMALVGPLTSVALGAAFILAGDLLWALPAHATGAPLASIQDQGPLTTLFLWLGPINVMLGVFNMLPGFPLDGGRVVRAILWGATHDLERATRYAARAGQALGWIFIGLGLAMAFGLVLPFVGGGFISGLWLAFIGWFLNGAALSSYRQVVVRGLLEEVPVRRLMRRQLPSAIEQWRTVRDLVDGLVMPTGESLFLVTDDGGRPIGVVRTHDVSGVPRDGWETTRVGDVATPLAELPAVGPEQDAWEALRAHGAELEDGLLVRDGDEVVGVLRGQDVARWLELHARRGGPSAPGTPLPHGP